MEYIGLSAFILFSAASLMVSVERRSMRSRSAADWITDIASLLMHFVVIPALQIIIVYGLMDFVVPEWKGKLASTWWLSIVLYIFLDYLWYWNHRIFHAQTPLWNLHKTHHAPEHIDVFVTPRNALITHFLMIYFWYIGVATYLLDDPTIFLAFAAFGTVINFWGHTKFSLPCNSWINKIISSLIVTPREHLWHHSRENPHCNFGTVFSVWDKLHGTMYCKTEHPAGYGEPSTKTTWNQLLWPF